MKNQYFGDINDFRKFGLLRALQTRGAHELLIAWMLTPDDGGSDGGNRSYAQRPGQWRHFDPDLFDWISSTPQDRTLRDVSRLSDSGLIPRAAYHDVTVPDGRTQRKTWFRGLINEAKGKDLVFLDPDNGIEVPSKDVGRKGSSKYVFWPEIEELWGAGCSLLVYQHFRREPRIEFVKRMVTELRERTGAPFAGAFVTAHVVFLLVAQDRHEASIKESISYSLPRWAGQIHVI